MRTSSTTFRKHKSKFLLIMCLLASGPSMAQFSIQNTRFDHIHNFQGLSQNTVRTIIQDQKGFIWIGTEDGLNRYDGKSFEVFGFSALNESSNEFNFVTALYEDDQGDIWVGTLGDGLFRFDWTSERFEEVKLDENEELSTQYITSITASSDGDIWVATGAGLYRIGRKNNLTSLYTYQPGEANSLSSEDIMTLEFDGTYIWVGTRVNGLNRINPENGQINRYSTDSGDFRLLSNTILSIHASQNGLLMIGSPQGLQIVLPVGSTVSVDELRGTPVNAIFQDSKSNIWAGSDQGVYVYEAITEQWVHLVAAEEYPHSLSGTRINVFMEDYSGALWIGTQFQGINKYDPRKHKFSSYRTQSSSGLSLPSNILRCFAEDQNGEVWIGTTGGLIVFDPKTKQYSLPSELLSGRLQLPHSDIRTIMVDEQNNLWLGTRNGLTYYDRRNAKLTNYKSDPENSKTLSGNHIRTLLKDGNTLWIGTHDNGLNKLNLDTDEITRYIDNPTYNLEAKRVTTLLIDPNNTLWVGTSALGLNKLVVSEDGQESFERFTPQNSDIPSNIIKHIMLTEQGQFWIATANGFSLFDVERGLFKNYSTPHGLANKMIYGLLEDNHGDLWMSTNSGLSRFNISSESFANYDVQDGLQANEFNTNAFFKTSKGLLCFGGINGFNIFHPDEIEDRRTDPRIVITDFQLFYKSQNPSAGGILPRHVSEVTEISLNYDQNVFSFEFVLLDYSNPEQNTYKYKLEGFDNAWIDALGRNFATYTTLPAGEYTFRVTGQNSDGYSSTVPASVHIIVNEPWWKATWFLMLSVVSVLLTSIGFVLMRQRQIKIRQMILEKRVEERTEELMRINRELKAYDHMISHDLKGPIGNIHMILNYILNDKTLYISDDHKELLRQMVNSSDKAITLINDILAFAAADKDKASLETVDLSETAREVISALQPTIKLSFARVTALDLPEVQAIPVKAYQLLYNLINNALKFRTDEENPIITIYSKKANGVTEVIVEDNGIGFEKEKAEEIFTPLTRLHGSTTYEGSGLGLAICQRIVDFHGWKIRAESELGKGSRFIISIPL